MGALVYNHASISLANIERICSRPKSALSYIFLSNVFPRTYTSLRAHARLDTPSANDKEDVMDVSTCTVGNAAGFIKGPGVRLDDLLRSPAQEITIGSITLEPRDGNPGNVYQTTETGTSINSLGLRNPGQVAASDFMPDLHQRTRAVGKRLRVSLAGFSPDEYTKLARAFMRSADTLELNLGCPNVWGSSGQKPIASFDRSLMELILAEVFRATKKSSVRIAVKLSPYTNPEELHETAMLLKAFGRTKVQEVVTSNTFPNGILFDTDGKRLIDMEYGGIGGTALKGIALGQVAQFAKHLHGAGMRIVGVGGVSSGQDLIAMCTVGASGVQIGTAYDERGARIFSDVLQEAA
jgi:dihydroorotate dehydrogenase (fumarate)